MIFHIMTYVTQACAKVAISLVIPFGILDFGFGIAETLAMKDFQSIQTMQA